MHRAQVSWAELHRDCIAHRYHYNVSPDRLDVHVKKGWQDRLSITSVGSCQGLWALIMDSNPGYISQVPHTPRPQLKTSDRCKHLSLTLTSFVHSAQMYQITSQFLSKEWIMEKWDAGFYITAVAGAALNTTPFLGERCDFDAQHTRRTVFEVSRSVAPCKLQTLRATVCVRCAGADGGKSLVVMSKGTKFTQQSYKVLVATTLLAQSMASVIIFAWHT
jgi:hypothetical protein